MRNVIVLLLFVWTVPAHAADWPHVRGVSYDATSTEKGIVDIWSEKGPPILWSRELGAGYSSVVVAQGKAYTLYQTSAGMFVIALDADTGQIAWEKRVDWPWQPGGIYPGPYASPTWSDGNIYYSTPTGIVGCLRATDGSSLWNVNVRETFGSRGTEFGYASTPTVEDGRVYLPVGGPNASMVALNAVDGKTLWASGDDPASYCPAYPITLDGRRLIVGFFQNSLSLYDAKSGERVWRERFSTSYDEHSAWPIFHNNRLLIASPFRVGSHLYELSTQDSKVLSKPVWHHGQFSNDICSSVLFEGHVFGFDLQQFQASVHRPAKGAFKCLDFNTGAVRWETNEVGQASVLLADGKLILWTETGTLILANATAKGYEERARADVLKGGGMCWAAPTLSDKRLYVRDHRRVVCLYLGAASELDPARPTVTLNLTDNRIDWSRWIPVEPDYPNDEPGVRDIANWFGWCLGIVIISAICARLLRWCFPKWNAMTVFMAIAFTLGCLGTTIIGTCFHTFALTWPLALYVAFRGVVALGLDRNKQGWKKQVFNRLALAGFIALCYGYFRLCMAIGYAMAWGFLIGFIPAFPFAFIASRTGKPILRWLCELLGFIAYFWLSSMIPGWKAALVAH